MQLLQKNTVFTLNLSKENAIGFTIENNHDRILEDYPYDIFLHQKYKKYLFTLFKRLRYFKINIQKIFSKIL